MQIQLINFTKYRSTLLLFLMALCLNTAAQENGIESEIANYKNSEPEMISKARRMLIDKIKENDYLKIKEIKDYLVKEREEKNYAALYLKEYWLILYWTQEYEELLENVRNTGFDKNAKLISNKTNWNNNSKSELLIQLQEKSTADNEMIIVLIDNAEINSEEKDFLKFHLKFCLNENQDSLNYQADKFLIKYPTSIYGPFIKKVIKNKQIDSPFAWGYDVFLGYTLFNGGISETFTDCFSFGMTIDFYYRNFLMSFAFSLGGTELKKDIPFNVITWDKGRQADILLPQANLGYTFFNDKRINITPFIGISGTYIYPNYNDTPASTLYDEIELVADASWNIGLCLSLNSKTINTPLYMRRRNKIKAFIKLKYNYINSGFKKEYYGLNGAMHQITMSFGAKAWKVREQ